MNRSDKIIAIKDKILSAIQNQDHKKFFIANLHKLFVDNHAIDVMYSYTITDYNKLDNYLSMCLATATILWLVYINDNDFLDFYRGDISKLSEELFKSILVKRYEIPDGLSQELRNFYLSPMFSREEQIEMEMISFRIISSKLKNLNNI